MSIRVQPGPGPDAPTTVSITDDLDLSTAPELDRALESAQSDGRVVVIDLRGLSFMDSSGLRAILAADARARAAGSRLLVIPGPPSVQRVFSLTLLDRRLEFVDDPSGAGG